MPESVSGVDAIVVALRDAAMDPLDDGDLMVPLADAVAAVLAAADARTAEIVEMLAEQGGTGEQRWASSWCADLVARRFPNGGTHDG